MHNVRQIGFEMGTDIHTNIEVFNKKTRKWERKALYYKDDDGSFKETWTLLDNRNYILFGKLAGIRTTEKPFVYPRGLPDDLSDETNALYGDGFYYHTPTWYDYCELCLYSQTENAFVTNDLYDVEKDEYVLHDKWNVVEPFIAAINMILEAYGVYYPDPGDVRIVMWFDS